MLPQAEVQRLHEAAAATQAASDMHALAAHAELLRLAGLLDSHLQALDAQQLQQEQVHSPNNRCCVISTCCVYKPAAPPFPRLHTCISSCSSAPVPPQRVDGLQCRHITHISLNTQFPMSIHIHTGGVPCCAGRHPATAAACRSSPAAAGSGCAPLASHRHAGIHAARCSVVAAAAATATCATREPHTRHRLAHYPAPCFQQPSSHQHASHSRTFCSQCFLGCTRPVGRVGGAGSRDRGPVPGGPRGQANQPACQPAGCAAGGGAGTPVGAAGGCQSRGAGADGGHHGNRRAAAGGGVGMVGCMRVV